MINLGTIQRLVVVKKVDFGVYLAEDKSDADKVLLPAKQVPNGVGVGDELEVFIYRDSKDRLISTTNEPLLTLGGLAVLKVNEVGKIGAFLDWGLEKDLFLPFKQQTRRVREGDDCLVTLYIDKSNRLCASMNVYEALSSNSPYNIEDTVTGRIYERSSNFGLFVAVDDKYSALIPKKDCQGDLQIGDIITARVTRVLEDGKLDLSVRKKAYLQMDEDAKIVLGVIASYDGVLPFNDKVSPEIIKRETGLSKAAFKRAVGKLLKEGTIEITEKNIRRK